MRTQMSNETDKLLDLQIEVIQISIYCDIVKNLLLKHRSISVIKIISFSFMKKSIRFFVRKTI